MDDDTCFGLKPWGGLSAIGNQEYSSVLAKNSPLVEVRDSFFIALLLVLCCTIHTHVWSMARRIFGLTYGMCHLCCDLQWSGVTLPDFIDFWDIVREFQHDKCRN